MAAPEPRLATGGNAIDPVLNILGQLGTGRTTTRSTVEGGVNDQADALMQSILHSVNPDAMSSLVQGILLKAKAGLGPNIAASLAAGNRSVSDSSLASLQSEAAAKATAESAQAILEAQINAQRIASGIVDTKIQNSKVTSSQTGASPAGKALAALAAMRKGQNLFSSGNKSKEKPTPPKDEEAAQAADEAKKDEEASQGTDESNPEALGREAGPVTDTIPNSDFTGDNASDPLSAFLNDPNASDLSLPDLAPSNTTGGDTGGSGEGGGDEAAPVQEVDTSDLGF